MAAMETPAARQPEPLPPFKGSAPSSAEPGAQEPVVNELPGINFVPPASSIPQGSGPSDGAYYAQPQGSMQQGYYAAPYGGYPEKSRGANTGLIVLVVVMAICLLGGGVYLLANNSSKDSAAPGTAPATAPVSNTLVVNQIVYGETCASLKTGGYDDMAEGASVTLVTGSSSNAQVIAATTWADCKNVTGGVGITATFIVKGTVPNIIGVDTNGVRSIYWTTADEFPLSLTLGSEK